MSSGVGRQSRMPWCGAAREIEKQSWSRNKKLNSKQYFAKRVKSDFGHFREISVTL